MRKITLTIIICLASLGFSYAQINVLEAGLRFNQFETIAIDATFPIAAKPRLHPSLYLSDAGAALGAYFDWMFEVEGGEGLKLYPGVGPELYFYNDVHVGIAGNFGMEYSFDFPLTLGFDWRPGLLLTSGGDFHTNNWGFMTRYRF